MDIEDKKLWNVICDDEKNKAGSDHGLTHNVPAPLYKATHSCVKFRLGSSLGSWHTTSFPGFGVIWTQEQNLGQGHSCVIVKDCKYLHLRSEVVVSSGALLPFVLVLLLLSLPCGLVALLARFLAQISPSFPWLRRCRLVRRYPTRTTL